MIELMFKKKTTQNFINSWKWFTMGEKEIIFLSLLLRKQKHWHSQLKITFVKILHAKF